MGAEYPLRGLKVVAVEQAVAAPFCSSRLADAGAEVIKIERPDGDFARLYDEAVNGQSSYFVWLNRGKTSKVLDLSQPEGKAHLHDLLSDADVFIQNLKPGSMKKLGFDLPFLRKQYPGLILCSISGYDEIGPLANRKAYDLLIQAESGLASVTGEPEHAARVGISVVDIATGLTAYGAILEALIGRSITGVGADIRVAMFDVMADWLTVPLLLHEGGKPTGRTGLAHPSIAPYGAFKTADGKEILIAIQSDREWRSFCVKFLGKPELADDDRFETNIARVANRHVTDQFVAATFANLIYSHALERLDHADVAYASVNDMAALSSHPQIRRIAVKTPAGPVSYPAPAPIFMDARRAYGPVPALGQDVFDSVVNRTERRGEK